MLLKRIKHTTYIRPPPHLELRVQLSVRRKIAPGSPEVRPQVHAALSRVPRLVPRLKGQQRVVGANSLVKLPPGMHAQRRHVTATLILRASLRSGHVFVCNGGRGRGTSATALNTRVSLCTPPAIKFFNLFLLHKFSHIKLSHIKVSHANFK